VEARIEDRRSDTLILVEHPHVFTLGRRGDRSNLLSADLPVYHVERGGDVTYHGPGQLVGYPILKLLGPEQDIHGYLNRIEEVIIRTVSNFGVEAERSNRQTGVWVGEKKLASIGVAVKSWVTYHGFSLNVNTNLTYFGKIRPCGLESTTITSMEKLTGKKIEIQAVKRRLALGFKDVFQRDLRATSLETISSQLNLQSNHSSFRP
jgi:lipoate-protein ligase B